jgi:peptide/nickel transport system substrate-binding protein
MPYRLWALISAGLALLACAAAPVRGESVLRVTPHSNLVILDPVWTTAYITRNHGYMVYDTLFGTDADGVVKPQMVDKWDLSRDKKTWTFQLRDGLEFHDGRPVTSKDVIASLDRWAKRDAMGMKLMSFVERMEAVSAKTFRLHLSEPYGLVLESLGKPSSNVPFIMPERVARTPADRQIEEFTGSGPFIFRRDEWRPGEKVVYVRNPRYRPRSEPPSGTAGAKSVKVDRVEWIIIKDPQTQANALLAGEIDIIESPAHELYAQLSPSPDVQLFESNPKGFQAGLRFNHVVPPLNDPAVRRAAMAALNQPAFLRAQVGVPGMFRTCFSAYPCGSPLASDAGMEFIARPDLNRARQLLKESGYDGTPIVIMQPTDLSVIAKLPVVAAQLLRQAGFRVDLQAMDWQTLVSRRAKKDPPSQGGWNIFCTIFASVDMANPIANQPLSGACDKAWFGWACDAELEKLRDAFARTDDPAEQRRLAQAVQARAMEVGTYVPLGEYLIPVAARRNVSGLVVGHFLVLWNVEKK